MLVPLLVGVATILALGTALVSQSRRRLLARIRAEWGTPRERVHKMQSVAAYHRSLAAAGVSSLDDRTWDDLMLDAVFKRLDRTESTLGQQALYHRLRTAPVADHLDAFEALVTQMSSDAGTRERAQMALARLRDPHGYDLWWLGQPNAVESRSWYVLFPVLTVSTLSALLLAPFWSSAVAPLVALLLLNLIVRYGTDRQIGTVTAAFRQLAPLVATGQSLSFLGRDDIDPIVGVLREVPRFTRLKNVARWVSGDPFMLPVASSWLAVALTDCANMVYEYLNLAFLLDANAVYFGGRDLRANGPALLAVVAGIGEVDAAISVASFRAEISGWTRPRFLASGAPMALTDVIHPLVDEPVPNSIVVGPGQGVLITGSNMSGKSTFLRTIGVNAVLAQTINTCLAGAYDAPLLLVRTCIGRGDDLIAGKSYYLVEVRAVLALVQASDQSAQHLFLFDELFRGTNATERVAAGEAALRYLVANGARSRPHIVLAATHDGELVDLLEGRYVPYHFGDSVGSNGLVFDYRCSQGLQPPATRLLCCAFTMRQTHSWIRPSRVWRRSIICASG